jgi:DNA ligase (NAD+)
MDEKSIKEKIEELRKIIRYHDYKYYIENQPEISDYEYDKLMRELIELEKKYPQFITPDSPTQRVAGAPLKKFNTVSHKVPMLSLDNTYSQEELIEFDERVKKIIGNYPYHYAVELKIDGVAVSLLYKDGVFVRGATRGDGYTGDDISLNLRTIKTVPLKVESKNIPKELEIRGEVYLTRKAFEKINEEREMEGEVLFANPRNAAAGSLKLLDPKEVAKRGLDIFIHSVVLTDEIPWQTHCEALDELKKAGFKVSLVYEFCKNINEVIKVCNDWEVKRDKLPFDIDGMVIKVNEYKYYKVLGTTTKSPRYAIAYKFPARQATTKLINVSFQVGRTGSITPVAELEPVELSGSTITRCTLHNEDEIRRKDIRINDTVIIEKAGEVIPAIVKVVESKRTGKEKKIEFPKFCPACHSPIRRPEGEVAWRCENAGCIAQLERTLEHFTSRSAMNIEGFGKAIIQQLVAKKLVKDYADLYFLKKEDILKLERMAEKSATNLLNALENSKNRELAQVIFALGIRHVGKHIAEILAENYDSLDSLMKAKREELESIEGIGPIVAESIVHFFSNPRNIEIIKKLKSAGINPKRKKVEKVNPYFANKTFVLTGELEKYTRYEAEKLIKEMGGKTASSVSKKVDYVIVGKNPGEKYNKAKKLNIKIIDEETFEKWRSQFS